jgi:hypothetical protein
MGYGGRAAAARAAGSLYPRSRARPALAGAWSKGRWRLAVWRLAQEPHGAAASEVGGFRGHGAAGGAADGDWMLQPGPQLQC